MDTSSSSLPSPSCPDGKKRSVCYYYDPEISKFTYGDDHHMVPRRISMAHHLIDSYHLLGRMRRLRKCPATEDDLLVFHTDDYVDFLRDVTPKNVHEERMSKEAQWYHIGETGDHHDGRGGYDNPVMDGLWDYCRSYTGGSLAAARGLGKGGNDIAINWSGGLHHARACQAKGFCYVNDIVLAIHELFDYFKRVLYLDIDVHHGDGVEEAFYTTNRIMTVSFHQGGDMFPQTGKINDIGYQEGLYHNLNVPLKAGMDDNSYHQLFKPIMKKVMEVFQPEAVVLQCGADSLAGDKLGELNLSIKGHAQCVEYMRSFNVPLLLLGGGGYTINHVAACWCYETAVAIGTDIADKIPDHGYDYYYESQGYKLHYPTSKMQNQNTEKDLERTKETIFSYISKLEAAPSVQFQERRDRIDDDDDDETDEEYEEGHYDDDDSVLYDSTSDEEDPIERLHRMCCDADVENFLKAMGNLQFQ